MPYPREYDDALELPDRLRNADTVTARLLSAVVSAVCRRFPSLRQSEKTARIECLIASQAWIDAVLALVDLELPLWQVRRIAYDEGEWHCALSRERELPEWLDQSIEAHHPDLPLAILSAFVDARLATAPSNRTSVPRVPYDASAPHQPLCCDNFA